MRHIEILADAGHLDTLDGIAQQHEVNDHWQGGIVNDGRIIFHMLVSDARRQSVVDALQNQLGTSAGTRIIIQPVDAVLPRPETQVKSEKGDRESVAQTREELYNEIAGGARLDNNFILLVFLSSVVACIGLLENNVAVIVGAMVIAPLLGPNIALAFATSLGDRVLIWHSIRTNLAGLGLALLIATVIGYIWHGSLDTSEIIARTDVNIAGVILALASGAAAVLSLITGLSSALVGVMVAVALLPPTATLGLMLGSGNLYAAAGAALLLAVNVVCINLSAKLVFLFKGVKPRTWLEKNKARQSVAIYASVWIVLLTLLIVAIVLRHRVIV